MAKDFRNHEQIDPDYVIGVVRHGGEVLSIEEFSRKMTYMFKEGRIFVSPIMNKLGLSPGSYWSTYIRADDTTIIEIYSDEDRNNIIAVYVEKDSQFFVYSNKERTVLIDSGIINKETK